MKISNNNILKTYTDLHSHTKGKTGTYKTLDSEHNFDAITIQSNPRDIAEHTFSSALAKKLSSDVAPPVSQEYLQDLRKQVSTRSYQPDPIAIAPKILLVEER